MTTKHYTNGEVTVTWKPDKCTHSAKCISGLPGVFDVDRNPWIDMKGATTDEIVTQVAMCPSGALSCHRNTDAKG
jgi:uncharacterized Fe-S cluster protein YjdI